MELKIVNAVGTLIHQKLLRKGQVDYSVNLDLHPGVYFINLIDKKTQERQVEKIVVYNE